MSSHREYWDRVGYVCIENSNGDMIEYRGLDFKFKVKSIAGIYKDFSVSVLGLSSDTINDLTVWNPVKAIRHPRKIEVWAGYANTGAEVIATGYVWYALPTRPPEMWMNFECRQFLKYNDMISNPYVLHNRSVKEIFNVLAAECGYRADWQASGGDVVIGAYTVEGKKGDLMKQFVHTFNKSVSERSRAYICVDPHGERRTPTKQILASIDTGLLAVGNINIKGARITTRLRADVQLMDWIYLESILIPSASGSYYVIEVEMEGHLRGDKWESRYNCLRKV